jgi:hypothetical protein
MPVSISSLYLSPYFLLYSVSKYSWIASVTLVETIFAESNISSKNSVGDNPNNSVIKSKGNISLFFFVGALF